MIEQIYDLFYKIIGQIILFYKALPAFAGVSLFTFMIALTILSIVSSALINRVNNPSLTVAQARATNRGVKARSNAKKAHRQAQFEMNLQNGDYV